MRKNMIVMTEAQRRHHVRMQKRKHQKIKMAKQNGFESVEQENNYYFEMACMQGRVKFVSAG